MENVSKTELVSKGSKCMPFITPAACNKFSCKVFYQNLLVFIQNFFSGQDGFDLLQYLNNPNAAPGSSAVIGDKSTAFIFIPVI